MTGSTFNGNTAVGGDGDGYGGAIYLDNDAGRPHHGRCLHLQLGLRAPTPNNEGGAVTTLTPAHIAASTLSANTATNGFGGRGHGGG